LRKIERKKCSRSVLNRFQDCNTGMFLLNKKTLQNNLIFVGVTHKNYFEILVEGRLKPWFMYGIKNYKNLEKKIVIKNKKFN
jgi:hypothetical protein